MESRNSIFGYQELDDEDYIYIEEFTPARHKFNTPDDVIFQLNSFICSSYGVDWSGLERSTS